MTTVIDDIQDVSAAARNAARQLELRRGPPDKLELLEHSWKSTVLRATWRHPRRWGVVLKRCQAGLAETEAAVYTEILPRIPVRAPRLFGVWREGTATWLALEDLGDEPPRLEDNRRREMLSRWLGELHRASRDLAGTPPLPDRGAQHFAGLLAVARGRLVERRAGVVGGHDQGRLDWAIGLCDMLDSSWGAVEAQAALLPATFVHADLAPENLRVVRDGRRLGVTAIDWEKAGTGTPFADLAMADAAAYSDAAAVPLEIVSASTWVARLLAALSHNWAVKPISEVERYGRRIERALESIRER